MINEHGHLITVGQCLALARPTSVHLDEDEVQAYITECEDMHIIPAIGFANFQTAVNSETFDKTFDDTFSASIWLDGGAFTTDCECDGRTEWCAGLRKTLAYYVYAKCFVPTGRLLPVQGR